MAGLLVNAVCPETAFSTSAKTMLGAAAPAQQRLKVHEWSISFIGTSNTAQPVRVELMTGATSAGTSTAISPLTKDNPGDPETVQSTGFYNCTVEPTGTLAAIKTEEVHPQTGYTWQAPYGKEVGVKGGNYITLRVTAAAGTSCAARLNLEE